MKVDIFVLVKMLFLRCGEKKSVSTEEPEQNELCELGVVHNPLGNNDVCLFNHFTKVMQHSCNTAS